MCVANIFVAYVKPNSYFDRERRIQKLFLHILKGYTTKELLSNVPFLLIH